MQPQYSALNNTTAFLPQYFDRPQAVTVIGTGANAGQIVPGSGNLYNGLVLGGSGFPQTAIGRVNWNRTIRR